MLVKSLMKWCLATHCLCGSGRSNLDQWLVIWRLNTVQRCVLPLSWYQLGTPFWSEISCEVLTGYWPPATDYFCIFVIFMETIWSCSRGLCRVECLCGGLREYISAFSVAFIRHWQRLQSGEDISLRSWLAAGVFLIVPLMLEWITAQRGRV